MFLPRKYIGLHALPLIAILTCGLLFAAGCRRQPLHEPEFRRAEMLLDSLPEQTLAILDSIDPATLRPGLDSARYILLHALAEDKCYEFITPDSTLVAISMIFQHFDKSNELRQIYYLLGSSLDRQERYAEAVGYLLDAENLFNDNTPELEKGLIYNELAECCNATLNGDHAIKYIKMAHNAYLKANKRHHASAALYNLTTFYN